MGSGEDNGAHAGTFEAAGVVNLEKVSLASLALTSTSNTYLPAPSRVTMRGTAHVAGPLRVRVTFPARAHDGLRVTVLTAKGGISGQFSSITSGDSGYSITLSYEPDRIVAIYHAA